MPRPKRTEEEKKAARKAAYEKRKAEFLAAGLTANGKPRKRGGGGAARPPFPTRPLPPVPGGRAFPKGPLPPAPRRYNKPLPPTPVRRPVPLALGAAPGTFTSKTHRRKRIEATRQAVVVNGKMYTSDQHLYGDVVIRSSWRGGRLVPNPRPSAVNGFIQDFSHLPLTMGAAEARQRETDKNRKLAADSLYYRNHTFHLFVIDPDTLQNPAYKDYLHVGELVSPI